MSADRGEPDATRKLLKTFGVAVTDYRELTRQLLDRRARAGTAEEITAIEREAAEATARLHQRLQEITHHVLQLQSDFLVGLVARQSADDQPASD